MKSVLAFGTFDRLHAGHLAYLRQARKLGDRLVVVVARDRTVRRLKKRKPAASEQRRRRAIQRLPFVDRALLGSRTDPYAVLRQLKPNVIALGYDQKFFATGLRRIVKKMKLHARIVRCRAYNPKRYHSSLLQTKRL